MSITHTQQGLIWRFFEGRLASQDCKPLLRHVSGCGECRSEFEQARMAYRALSGRADGAGLSRAESEIIEAAVLGARPTSPARRLAMWSGMAATTAAVLVLVFLRSPTVPDRLMARGVTAPAVGLDVLCLSRAASETPVSVRATGGRCPSGSFLKVLVTAPEAGLRFAAVVALDSQLEVRLVTRGRDVGASPIILAGHTKLGPIQRLLFVALFSNSEISELSLQAAVAQARAAGAAFTETIRLPLAAEAQHAVMVQAAGEGDAR